VAWLCGNGGFTRSYIDAVVVALPPESCRNGKFTRSYIDAVVVALPREYSKSCFFGLRLREVRFIFSIGNRSYWLPAEIGAAGPDGGQLAAWGLLP
jgi:hypothetical protein